MPENYCTSFCNHPHRVDSGKPVNHQCYIIPPAAIAAERDGDFLLARRLINAGKNYLMCGQPFLPVHRGIRERTDSDD